MTVLDDSVAILHGSVDNSLRWVWLSKKRGTVVVARVSDSGFWMREPEAPGVTEISAQLPRLWTYHCAGVNLAGHATHQLQAPQMQSIVPIPVPSMGEFKTEAMF
jgi:hypothetical protein